MTSLTLIRFQFCHFKHKNFFFFQKLVISSSSLKSKACIYIYFQNPNKLILLKLKKCNQESTYTKNLPLIQNNFAHSALYTSFCCCCSLFYFYHFAFIARYDTLDSINSKPYKVRGTINQ